MILMTVAVLSRTWGVALRSILDGFAASPAVKNGARSAHGSLAVHKHQLELGRRLNPKTVGASAPWRKWGLGQSPKVFQVTYSLLHAC